MLSLIFIVFVVASVVIVFISLLYAFSLLEKTLLITKVKEKVTLALEM